MVADLLPAAGISLTVGKPKVGKSTLARCLALAVARGGTWLDRQCTAGRVLVCAFEEKRSEVVRHFRELQATADDSIRLFVERAPAEDAIERLRATVAAHEPVLVVLDPLMLIARVQDESSYGQAMTAIEPLRELARESGAHVALVHHARKAEGQDGDEALGSTAWYGGVDTAVFLSRMEDREDRMVYSRGRYGEDIPERVLTFDGAAVTLGGDAETRRRERLRASVREYVAQHPDCTTTELKAGIKGRAKAIVDVLAALNDAGEITRTGDGRPGSPYRYVVVNSSSVPTVPVRSHDSGTDSFPFPDSGRYVVPESGMDMAGGGNGTTSVPERERTPAPVEMPKQPDGSTPAGVAYRRARGGE